MAGGTRWVGMSDMTSLQLGLLAHADGVTWAGPLACDDFGRSTAEGGVDDVTASCFVEAMSGALEAVGFRTDAGFDGLEVRGTLWGATDDRQLDARDALAGSAAASSLRRRHRDPYRVERNPLQLQQAGLDAQKAISRAVSGLASRPTIAATARDDARAGQAATRRQPLPLGHVPTKVTLPVGAKVRLVVDRRRPSSAGMIERAMSRAAIRRS